MKNILVLLSVVFLATGCVTHTVQTQNQNSTVATNFDEVKRVVLIPIKISVKESGVGSLEKLPEESELATKIVLSEVKAAFERSQIEMVEFVPENEEEQLLIDEYVALYQRVAGSAQSINYMGPAWKNKAGADFDYSLGDGLQFIKESTNADKAVFVFGEDIVTSGGKKALAVLAMIGGIGINPGGIAILHLGIVDLNDGHLVWSNSSASQSLSLDETKSVTGALNDILSNSPITAPK